MKIKFTLFVLIAFTFNANAQIYTPSGAIQGTSGNDYVGIGTNTPLYKLNVFGSHSDTRMLLHSVGGGGDDRQADLMLWASEPEVTYTGVGIGNNVTVSTNKGLHLLNPIRGGSYLRLLDNSMSFGVVSSTGVKNQSLNLDSEGNVGIGTTNPAAKFDVSGQINSYIASFGQFDYYTSTKNYANFSTNNHGSVLMSSNLYFSGNDDLKIANTHPSMSGGAITMPGNGQTNQGAILFYTNTSKSVVKDESYSGSISMAISGSGNVGVGVVNPSNKLDVNGTIHSKEVKVDMNGWSDFVFKKEYNLPTLEEVEEHIVEKGHLKDIPNEEEVLKNGINLGEMNTKLLQKIEELTLYVIEIKKENEAIKNENKVMRNNQTELEKRMSKIENK